MPSLFSTVLLAQLWFPLTAAWAQATAPPGAAAPAPLVVMAEPRLSAEITVAVQRSLARAIADALPKAGVRPAPRELILRQMRRLGLRDIASRASATRVASELRADAVLHHQARLIDQQIHLRVAAYFIASGKAVMLERAMLLQDLGPQVDRIVAELFRGTAQSVPSAPSAPSAPAPVRPDSPAAPATSAHHALAPRATIAAPAPPRTSAAATSGSAAALAAIARTNPHAGRGLVLRAIFGGSVPIGPSKDALSFGLRAGGELGYQVRVGRFQAITPQASASFSRWGVSTPGFDGGVSTTTALLGARYDLCLGPVVLWSALHLGFGLASARITEQITGDQLDDSAPGFAIGFNSGAQYMLAEAFGAGLFLDVTRAFVGQLGETAYDAGLEIGGGGFSFGLVLTTRIPF